MDKERLIDKYVSGSLDDAQQKDFEKLMEDDAKFSREVAFRRDLAAAAFEDERQVLKSRVQEVEKKMAGKGKSLFRRIMFIVIGLSLIAAAVIGYQMEKRQKSPEAIYAAHYQVYPNVYHPVTRGNSDVMTQAFMAYESGNYKEAAEFLEERMETSRAIPLKFYQAMAYGEIGNYPLAIRRLEDIRRFDSPYVAESYWYLGLYYIRQGNYDAAVPRLQTFYELTEDTERRKNTADLIRRLQGG